MDDQHWLVRSKPNSITPHISRNLFTTQQTHICPPWIYIVEIFQVLLDQAHNYARWVLEIKPWDRSHTRVLNLHTKYTDSCSGLHSLVRSTFEKSIITYQCWNCTEIWVVVEDTNLNTFGSRNFRGCIKKCLSYELSDNQCIWECVLEYNRRVQVTKRERNCGPHCQVLLCEPDLTRFRPKH